MRSLCFQEPGQRFSRKHLFRVIGKPCRELCIARANRDHALGERAITFVAPPLAHDARQNIGHARDDTEQHPDKDDEEGKGDQPDAAGQEARLGNIALPSESQRTGPVGQPRAARGNRDNGNEEKENAHHQAKSPATSSLWTMPHTPRRSETIG